MGFVQWLKGKMGSPPPKYDPLMEALRNRTYCHICAPRLFPWEKCPTCQSPLDPRLSLPVTTWAGQKKFIKGTHQCSGPDLIFLHCAVCRQWGWAPMSASKPVQEIVG